MANGPKKLLGAQVSENEEKALSRAFGGARTSAERKRLRRMLGMRKNPTTAGTERFGDFNVGRMLLKRRGRPKR